MAQQSGFAHLHSHGAHSLLDGLTSAEQAMNAAAADGQTAFALTDHGSLGGVLKCAQAAKSAGIKFIPGIELYLSIGDRHEQNHVMIPREEDFDGTGGDDGSAGEKRKIYEHLTVLATSKTGWRNLLELDNKTHDSFWGKPRSDYNLLAEHAQGLTVGTGCLGGPVAGQLLQGNSEQARANLTRLVDIFGRDGVFVEVMDHGIAAERRIVPGLVRLSREFGLPVVATNDAHYAQACDAEAHDAWLAISASKGAKKVLVSDTDRFRFNGEGYHLRTALEMHAIFDGQPGTENAVANSLRIAEAAEDNIVLGSLADHHRLPVYATPHGESVDAYFHERVRQGLIERYGSPLPQAVRERARMEEETIFAFGVAGYMLTIADVIAAERARGFIVGAGRGSAVSSIISFSLRITNVDPLENKLIFERFLNPTRAALPDIDSDFQSSRQYDVIRAAAEAYGHDRVARIGTYGNAWAKDALKKMGRVLDKDSLANQLAATIPGGDAKKWTLSSLLDQDNPMGAELRSRISDLGADAEQLVTMARAVEGSASAETIHACGVVISDEPLAGTIPLRRDRRNDDFPVTQWDAGDAEAAQFVKFDFLAIKDLDVVATTVDLVRASTGESVDVNALHPKLTDERSVKAKHMLAEGRTAGVFQLASKGITELTMKIRPDNLHDLAAILALYRPGPMGAGQHEQYARRRRGGEAVDYSVFTKVKAEQEVIASVLDTTLGSIVFQESLMQLARDIADFDGGQMSDLQKAFSKKKQPVMDALKKVWLSGGGKAERSDGTAKVAFRRETLENLWRAFEASGSYLFNSSHSYAYAMLSWQMAYLKSNWPAHFGAALLTHTDKAEKRQQVLTDLIAEGITVLPPSVNRSAASTSASTEGEILLGLSEIKDVGEAATAIIASREADGPYQSVFDLVARTGITSTAIQALAEAGALDEFGPRLGQAMVARAARVPGLSVPDMEWGVVERSARQRVRLGVAVGEHPLVVLHDQIRGWRTRMRGDTSFFQVHNLPEHDVASLNVIGVVAAAEEKAGRGGRRLVLQLESARGRIEAVMWANRYGAYRQLGNPIPFPGQIVALTGRLKATPVVVEVTDEADDPDGGDSTHLEVGETLLNLYAERLDPVDVEDPTSPLSAPDGAVLTLTLGPEPEPGPPRQSVVAIVPEPAGPAVAPVSAEACEPEPEPEGLHLVQYCRLTPFAFSTHLGPAWRVCQNLFPNAAEALEWWKGAQDGERFEMASPVAPVRLTLVATTGRTRGPFTVDTNLADHLAAYLPKKSLRRAS